MTIVFSTVRLSEDSWISVNLDKVVSVSVRPSLGGRYIVEAVLEDGTEIELGAFRDAEKAREFMQELLEGPK